MIKMRLKKLLTIGVFVWLAGWVVVACGGTAVPTPTSIPATETPTIPATLATQLPDLEISGYGVVYDDCPWGGPGSVSVNLNNFGVGDAGPFAAFHHQAAGRIGALSGQFPVTVAGALGGERLGVCMPLKVQSVGQLPKFGRQLGHQNLPLAFVSLMTFILIFSSVTMVLAVHEGHKMNRKGVEKYMILTILGGLAFLGCQAWEWTHLLTGEHIAMLNDGTLSIVPTTVKMNPWGTHVAHEAIAAALQSTPHDKLGEIGRPAMSWTRK